MKNTILIAIFLILFGSICFSGCEEIDSLISDATKPNYITVVIVADAFVMEKFVFHAKDGSTASQHTNLSRINVRFDMVKASGERHTLYSITDASGNTGKVSCSFQLYNEQGIECMASPEGVKKDIFPNSYKTISWDTVNASKNFGETYTWTVHHDLIGTNNVYET